VSGTEKMGGSGRRSGECHIGEGGRGRRCGEWNLATPLCVATLQSLAHHSPQPIFYPRHHTKFHCHRSLPLTTTPFFVTPPPAGEREQLRAQDPVFSRSSSRQPRRTTFATSLLLRGTRPGFATTRHHSPPLATTRHHSPPLATTRHHSPPLATTRHHSPPLFLGLRPGFPLPSLPHSILYTSLYPLYLTLSSIPQTILFTSLYPLYLRSAARPFFGTRCAPWQRYCSWWAVGSSSRR
jgi:hypothetical protein